MSFTLSSDASSQAKQAMKFFDALNAGDGARIFSLITESFVYEMLPPSLRAVGSRTVSELPGFLEALAKSVAGLNITPEEVVEGPNKVWVYAKSKGTITPTGAPYNNVYVFMFDFSPSVDGSAPRISRMREMLDAQIWNDVLNVAGDIWEGILRDPVS